MGVFDIFGSSVAQEAAGNQKAGIDAGYNKASTALGQGNTALTQNYTQGLQPFLQNYGTATAGTRSLTDALGITGDPAQVQARLAQTPGYQFQLEQGNENVLRNAARTGQLNSGAVNLDLQKQGQGLANQTYQQYVQNLMPFLGAGQNAAQGIGTLYSGLGQGLNQNFGSLAQLGYKSETDKGNADANATLDQNRANSQVLNTGMQAASMIATVF